MGRRRPPGMSQYLPPVRDRRFWVTQGLVVAVFVTHAILHMEVSGFPHVLVGFAYAFPVLYAALEFGFRGSVATTALVTVLTLPYVVDDWMTGARVDFAGHVLEVAILIVVAPVVGAVVEAERAERQAHQAAELRYRALFEASGVPAVVLDDSGTIQEANPTASDVLRGPLEGRTLSGVVGADTAERILGGHPGRFRIASGVELRPVVSRAGDEGERLTQVIFQDVTEEASGHRRAQAWGLAVLTAQEEERRRIAQELHDEALQLVVELRRRVERATKDRSGGLEELVEARTLADQVIDELRTVAVRLRPPDLEDLGLVASLERLVAESQYRGTQAEFRLEGEPTPLAQDVALALYRVGQEALSNAEHHGRAARVAVRLTFEPGRLTLAVADDGQGFDLDRAHVLAGGRHLGLVGMSERMNLVGGSLELRSSPGQGTTVVATAST